MDSDPKNTGRNLKRRLESEDSDDDDRSSKRVAGSPGSHEVSELESAETKNGWEVIKNIIVSINASQEKDIAIYFLTQFQELIENITNYADIERILSAVYSEKDGVLRFLRSRVGQRLFDEPKEMTFSIIKTLLDNQSIDTSLIVPHCVKLKDTINCIWKSSRESARLQAAALQCLVVLLKRYGNLISAYDIEASELYRTLLLSSEKTSIFQPSVRGEILQLLGLIANTYKNDVFKKNMQDQLFSYLLKIIKTQVESTQRQIEVSLLLGSIRGVDYFLRSYGSDPNYTAHVKVLAEIIKKIINPKISIAHQDSEGGAKKIKRREFQRAALTLLEHHGSLFKDVFCQQYPHWFTDIMTWCKSAHQEDSTRAKRAMSSFLRILSDFMSENPTSDELSVIRSCAINYFVEEFLDIWENSSAGNSDFEVCVEGLRLVNSLHLDPPLNTHLNAEVVEKFEKCIAELKKAERGGAYVEEMSQEEAESILPNLSSGDIIDFGLVLSGVNDEKLGRLVSKLIQSVKETDSFLRIHSSNLVAGIITIWEQLEANFDTDFMCHTICDLVTLDEDAVANSEGLCRWWMDMMTNKHKKLSEKAMFVEFLQFFGLSSNSSVQEMIRQYIAVINKQLVEQDKDAALMMNLLDGVISIYRGYPTNVELINSILLFVGTMVDCIQEYHNELENECSPGCQHYPSLLKAQEIFQNFLRSIQNSEADATGLILTENVYNIMNSGNPESSAVMYKFCLAPCLLNLNSTHVENFFEQNIFSIVSSATADPATTENDFISKTTALSLYENAITLTNRVYVSHTLNAAYVRSLPPPATQYKAGEVMRVILSLWEGIRKTPFTPMDTTNKRTRKAQYDYHSAAFNAASTILVAGAFTEAVILSKLLEDYKTIRTWEKIIDADTELLFPIVVDSTTVSGLSQTPIQDTASSIGDISTIHQRRRPEFKGNTLSTDAGKYDFTSGSGSTPSYLNMNKNGEVAPRGRGSGGYDLLKDHISMDRIIKVTRFLNSSMVDKPKSMPLWMLAIYKKISSKNVSPNVQIFMCGLVLNCQEIFKPYGDQFMESVISVIVAGSIRNHPTEKSSSLNSFERDLIGMLLSWSETQRPPSKSTEQIFNYSLQKVLCKRKDIQEQNLSLLTEMTRLWVKTSFSASSHEAILKMLGEEDKSFGLVVVIAILKGGVIPCDEQDLRTFIGTIGQCLSSSSMQNYELAAESLGLLLRTCNGRSINHFSQIVSHTRRFFTSEKGRAQPFVRMLKAVALNYPRLLVSFKSELEALAEHKPEVEGEAMTLLQIAQRQETPELPQDG